MLPVAERRGRLSEPTEPRTPPASATARLSAPPAARGADSSLGSSLSGSAHIYHHRVILGRVKPVVRGAEGEESDDTAAYTDVLASCLYLGWFKTSFKLSH